MKNIQLTEIIVERQKLIRVLYWLNRWTFRLFCVATVCILGTGCESYRMDAEFGKTHDFNFKQPSTKTKAVFLYEHKGPDIFGREQFLETIKNTGAFSQVAVANKERDLGKYPGWDVIRVQLTYFDAVSGMISAHAKYQVKIRLECKTVGEPAEYVYSSTLWHTALGATPPASVEAQPLTTRETIGFPSTKNLREVFTRQMILAAFSEAQRSGRYFQ